MNICHSKENGSLSSSSVLLYPQCVQRYPQVTCTENINFLLYKTRQKVMFIVKFEINFYENLVRKLL